MKDKEKVEINDFKRRLAQFTNQFTISKFYGKVIIHCASGVPTDVEVHHKETLKSLRDQK